MEDTDSTQLEKMFERLFTTNSAQANLHKWVQVEECIEQRDLIVVCNSQSGAGDEDEAGVMLNIVRV